MFFTASIVAGVVSERAKQDPLIRELKKTAPWCGWSRMVESRYHLSRYSLCVRKHRSAWGILQLLVTLGLATEFQWGYPWISYRRIVCLVTVVPKMIVQMDTFDQCVSCRIGQGRQGQNETRPPNFWESSGKFQSLISSEISSNTKQPRESQ